MENEMNSENWSQPNENQPPTGPQPEKKPFFQQILYVNCTKPIYRINPMFRIGIGWISDRYRMWYSEQD